MRIEGSVAVVTGSRAGDGGPLHSKLAAVSGADTIVVLMGAAHLNEIANDFVASGLYIGAALGPGPRDGLMTGLVGRTGRSIRLVRTGLEGAVVLAGWLLGGTLGVGTLAYAVTIGPLVQVFLPRLTVGPAPEPALAA